jgi:hypothetical protein
MRCGGWFILDRLEQSRHHIIAGAMVLFWVMDGGYREEDSILLHTTFIKSTQIIEGLILPSADSLT